MVAARILNELPERSNRLMFDTTKEDPRDLLRNAHEGRLQLPDFQRDYVWGDEDVRSLIASVAKGFPVGALLTLQTGGDIRLKPRLLAGVPERSATPDELLLDGQQRITSLCQSTYSDRPVRTRTHRGTEVDRFYYIDIRKALAAGADIDEAIIGVPADKGNSRAADAPRLSGFQDQSTCGHHDVLQ